MQTRGFVHSCTEKGGLEAQCTRKEGASPRTSLPSSSSTSMAAGAWKERLRNAALRRSRALASASSATALKVRHSIVGDEKLAISNVEVIPTHVAPSAQPAATLIPQDHEINPLVRQS